MSKTLRSEGKELARSQEMLLMRYFDGECGAVSRLRVRRLLQRSTMAQEYFDSLRQNAELCLSRESDVDTVNLWDRIENRIEAEERAAFFLGERDFVSPQGNFAARAIGGFSNWLRSGSMAGGLAGGAIAALAVFVILDSQQADVPGAPGGVEGAPRIAASTGRSAPTVNLASTGGSRFAEQAPVEVEWMRSDGRVRMIPDARSGAPIIWVKKHKGVPVIVRRRVLVNRPVNRPRTESRYGSEGIGSDSRDETPYPTEGLR